MNSDIQTDEHYFSAPFLFDYYTSAVISDPAVTFAGKELSLQSHMFQLYVAGSQGMGTPLWELARLEKNRTLPSLGWTWG